MTNVEDLNQITDAASLEELKTNLDAKTVDDAYHQAKEAYPELVQDELDEWYSQFNDDEFPYMSEKVGDTEIRVHGFAHGFSEKGGLLRHAYRLSTGIDLKDYELGDEVENFVHREVENWLDNDEPLYVEQRFSRKILEPFEDRDLIEEMDDVGFANINAFNQITSLTARRYSDLPTLFDGLKEKILGEEEERNSEDIEEILSDPSTIKDQQKLRHKNNLPVRLEEEWSKDKNLPNYFRTHFRSRRMAEYASKDSENERIHILCGVGHQPGIIDYLNYVDTESDEELDKFHEFEDALKPSETFDSLLWPAMYISSQTLSAGVGLNGLFLLAAGAASEDPQLALQGGAYITGSGAMINYGGNAIDKINDFTVSKRS